MNRLEVAEWLMMSGMQQASAIPERRCISCANCTVCRKNRYNDDDLGPPPKLVRVVPEETLRSPKTQIFKPVTFRSTFASSNDVTRHYGQPNDRIYKRNSSDNTEPTTKKKFCPSFIEYPITAPTPPTPPMTPPSPIVYRSADALSSSDEEEKRNMTDAIEVQKKKYKRAKYERTIKLYKFLIDLLEDQNPCVIWISRDTGIFKINNSEKLAQLWGEVKLNPTMNYEKLARSFRHYYKKGILDSGTTLSKCGKRKLYYKFSMQMLKKYSIIP